MSTSKRGITFIGALTMMFTLIFFHQFFMVNMSIQSLSMCFVYIIIGLATENRRGVAALTQQIWSITNNGGSEKERFELIKSFIRINVNKWDKYWNLWQEVIDNKKKDNALKRYFLKIQKGTLSLVQFLWILAYMIFSIFTSPTYAFGLTEPINFLIDLAGLAFFIYTGSRVIGVGDFMTNIFESLKTEGQIKQNLQLLESEIIFGARHYGFLKDKIDFKEEKQ